MAKYRVEIKPGKVGGKDGFWATAYHGGCYMAVEGGETAEEAKEALVRCLKECVANDVGYVTESMEIPEC